MKTATAKRREVRRHHGRQAGKPAGARPQTAIQTPGCLRWNKPAPLPTESGAGGQRASGSTGQGYSPQTRRSQHSRSPQNRTGQPAHKAPSATPTQVGRQTRYQPHLDMQITQWTQSRIRITEPALVSGIGKLVNSSQTIYNF